MKPGNTRPPTTTATPNSAKAVNSAIPQFIARHCGIALFIGSLASISLQSHASDADLFSEEDFLGEIPVVLSSTRLSQPILHAPSSITVIDRQMILAAGIRDLAELFRLVPGFQVSYLNGNTPAVTYHGFMDHYARGLQVLVDGRSIYSPFYGGVLWSQIPLVVDDIERIEVIRGPNAASYGANAFLAVINIKTRHASEDRGSYLNLNVGGPEQRRDLTARYGSEIGPVNYRLTFTHQEDNGYAELRDNRNANQLSSRFDYDINAKNRLMVQLAHAENNNGVGETDNNANQPRDRQITSGHFQIRWERNPDSDQSLSLQYYYNLHAIDDIQHFDKESPLLQEISATLAAALPGFDLLGVNPRGVIDPTVDAKRHDLELEYRQKLSPTLRSVAGASVRLDQLQSRSMFGHYNTLENHSSRLFSHAEWQLASHWIANGGAMWEQNDITGSDISPRLSFTYLADDHNSWRAQVSKATRVPVLYEEAIDNYYSVYTDSPHSNISSLPSLDQIIFYNLYSPGGLQEEKITSLELGFHHENRQGNGHVDLKLFHDQISDLIETLPYDDSPLTDSSNHLVIQSDVTTIKNWHDLTQQGIELQTEFKPDPKLRLQVNYAYLQTQGGNAVKGDLLLDSMPTHTLSSLLIYQPGRAHLYSMEYNHIDTTRWRNLPELTTATEKLDLLYRHRHQWGGTTITTSVQLNNLLGDRAVESQMGSVGPSAYLQFSVSHL